MKNKNLLSLQFCLSLIHKQGTRFAFFVGGGPDQPSANKEKIDVPDAKKTAEKKWNERTLEKPLRFNIDKNTFFNDLSKKLGIDKGEVIGAFERNFQNSGYRDIDDAWNRLKEKKCTAFKLEKGIGSFIGENREIIPITWNTFEIKYTPIEVDESQIAEAARKEAEDVRKFEEANQHRSEKVKDKKLLDQKEKLNTLFPDAEDGTVATITRNFNKNKVTAVKKGDDWVDDKGQHVPIYTNDKIELDRKLNPRNKEIGKPTLEDGDKLLTGVAQPMKLSEGQIKEAKTGNLKWERVAEELYANNSKLRETGVTIDEYAAKLEKYGAQSAKEKGYYWIIIPPKAKKIAAKENFIAQDEAARRTDRGRITTEGRVLRTYDKYKNALWNNEKVTVKGKLDKLVSNPKEWNDAWKLGYPINSRLIKTAFERAPYNKVPETKIRDGVRELMYHCVSANGINFDDIFKYFNQEGQIYTNLDGKPGNLKDLKEEWKLLDGGLSQKIEENKKNGRALNAGFSKAENAAYQVAGFGVKDRMEEIMQILKGGAVIFDSLVNSIRSESEAIGYTVKKAAQKVSKEDLKITTANNKYVSNNEELATPDRIDEYVNKEEKWNDMWEHNKGNIGILKRAFQRPPFNKVTLEVAKGKIREAMYTTIGKNDIDMDDLLGNLNQDGAIFETSDGQPLDSYDKFVKEYKGASVEKRARLDELYTSSAYIFDAIGKLDPNGKYEESVEQRGDAKAALDTIFPPYDSGAINGQAQDYYDTYAQDGTAIAGGTFSGLFKYDFRDRAKGISKLDLVSSNATANTMIRDSADFDGEKLNPEKLQNKLNALIHLGITSLITQPDGATGKKEALSALGINKDQLKTGASTLIKQAAEANLIDFKKSTIVTPLQQDLIRLGFMMERVSKPLDVADAPEKPIEWSDDPNTRELQKEAKRLGATPEAIAKINTVVKEQMIAFFGMKFKPNFQGVDELNVTIPIPLAGKEGKSLYLGINGGAQFDNGNITPVFRAGIGGSADIVNNLKVGRLAVIGGAGIGTDLNAFAGLGVSWDIPVMKQTAWDPNLTIGAMANIDLKALPNSSVLVGATLMFSRNLGRQFEMDVTKDLERNGYKAIEAAKDIPTKARLLRSLPGANGVAISQAADYLNLSDEELVNNLYEKHIRKQFELQTAEAGLSEHKLLGFLPPVMAAGIGFGVQITPATGGIPTFIPGVAAAISIGSELILFQRPTSNSTDRSAHIGQQLNDQIKARREAIDKLSAEGTTVSIETISPVLVGDMESGLKPIKTEVGSAGNSSANETIDGKQPDALEKIFQKMNADLAKKQMHLEKVESDGMYKLKIDNIGNLEFYVDPQMQERVGVFLKGGEIYISATANPNIQLARVDEYFPRTVDGNIKKTVVVLTDKDFRLVDEERSGSEQQKILQFAKGIKSESDFYIESRTKDQTGSERTPLTLMFAGGRQRNEIKQFNLREWKAGEDYRYFDNLNTKLEGNLENRANYERDLNLAKEAQKRIGSLDFSFSADKIGEIQNKAGLFMVSHPIEYRKLTTHQYNKAADIVALNTLILKENPGMTESELAFFKQECFHMSMTEKDSSGHYQEKSVTEREKIKDSRLTWELYSIEIPFFKKYLNANNNPRNFTPEAVAKAFIEPIRQMSLAQIPEDVPVGTPLDVRVGSRNILGRRQDTRIALLTNLPGNRLYTTGKDYANALMTPDAQITDKDTAMDKTIAMVLREAERPLENTDDTTFLRSPIAQSLIQTGVKENSPGLIYALGADNYALLLKCYPEDPAHPGNYLPAQAVAGSEGAIKALRDLATKISDVQAGKTPSITMKVGNQEFMGMEYNGVIIGVRTKSLKTGVYERCLNAANTYEDEFVIRRQQEVYTQEGNMRVYGAKAATNLTPDERMRAISVGVGAAAPIKAPPPPRIYTPANPTAGPGGQVKVDQPQIPIANVPKGSGANE